MTNNQSPDMPEEITAKRNDPELLCEDAFGNRARYIRADLIKPEPVADKQSVLEQVELAISLIRQDKYDDCELSLTTMRCMLEQEPVADLEALKREVTDRLVGGTSSDYSASSTSKLLCLKIEGTIDYLAAQGHLRPAVPRDDATIPMKVLNDVIGYLRIIEDVTGRGIIGSNVSEALCALKPYAEGK